MFFLCLPPVLTEASEVGKAPDGLIFCSNISFSFGYCCKRLHLCSMVRQCMLYSCYVLQMFWLTHFFYSCSSGVKIHLRMLLLCFVYIFCPLIIPTFTSLLPISTIYLQTVHGSSGLRHADGINCAKIANNNKSKTCCWNSNASLAQADLWQIFQKNSSDVSDLMWHDFIQFAN